MAVILVFHAVMMLIGLGIVSPALPLQAVSNMLGYLHKTIGITTPSQEQVRMVALIWIGSVIVIVDGCLFLLVFIAKLSTTG